MLLSAKKRNTPSTDPNAGYVTLFVDLATGKLMALDESGVVHEYVETTDLSVYALASALSNYALASALADYALKANVLDLFKVTRTLGDNYVAIGGPDTETTFFRGTVLTAERNVSIDAKDIINVAGVTDAEKTAILLEIGYKIRISGTATRDGIYTGETDALVWTNEEDGVTWTMKTSSDAIEFAQSGTCLVTSGESYIQREGSLPLLAENAVLRVSGLEGYGSYTIYETQVLETATRYWINELLPEPDKAVLLCQLDYIDGKNYVITHNLGSERIRISGYFTDSPLPDPAAVWQYFDNKDAFFTINDENSIEADMNGFVDGDTVILVIEKID